MDQAGAGANDRRAGSTDHSSKSEVAAMTDPLSEVLRSIRLKGGVFLDAYFTQPWCVLSQITADDCRFALPAATQVIAYHFIIDGRFFLTVEGESPIEVRAGEAVLLPRNDPHTLAGASGLTPIDARDLIQPSVDGGLTRISHGGGGEPVHLVCGFLASEDLHNPLIATLPRVLKLDVRQGASRDWVEASVRFAASELTKGRFASSNVMSRLSELLLVEAVRDYSSTLASQEVGWLKGLADPYVGRALALIHHNVSKPWSAEALAKEVALSRSAFMDRFTTLVGIPPIRYLTVWRLQTAKLNLREIRMTIAQLAHSVGYESEEAFSRAFKREFGMAPARWREQQSLG
jgi:AraC-like DNA-binding protein/mannose-6-phosphate isomerase-like protein (cupin superfamily)